MKTILCYGDSNTWGMVPMVSLTSSARHIQADRWPSSVQARLGASFQIIAEGLNGRTTVFDDPIDGAHENGRSYLLPFLESHAPSDAVIIILGTNDLKSASTSRPMMSRPEGANWHGWSRPRCAGRTGCSRGCSC